MGKNEGFESLEAWQKAREIRRIVFKVTKNFPKHERYDLHDQITRSSRSVSANIAEGYGRFHFKESIQFCRIARGSLSETMNHMIESKECGYVSEELMSEFRNEYTSCMRLINGFVRYLNQVAERN